MKKNKAVLFGHLSIQLFNYFFSTQTIDIHDRGLAESKYKGFVPLYNITKEKLDTVSFKNSIDSNNVKTFLSFIEDCIKKK